jgi:4-diphosphocytidyl-2-C-methyl-D-erythritol kinase
MSVAHLLYRCYAKVNLTLEVLGKRADGYHDLASLVHTISLADDLRIDSATNLLSRVEGLDLDPDTNLVNRAARLLGATTAMRLGAELTLVKRIPAAAGLGGGSSDAATTLIGLNSLWDTRLGLADLSALAAELGSDVPFFVRGGAAMVGGRGDELRTLPPVLGQWLVIVVPAHDVLDKTSRLYAALEPADFSNGELTRAAADRLVQRLPVGEDDLSNAFARAARSVFPGLSDVWTRVEAIAQRRFFLSGAGPALFALAADRADARHQQARLGRLGLVVVAARTVRHARAALKFASDTPIRYP